MDKLTEIEKRLESIETALKNANKRFSWEEKVTESGIQLAGGPTTVVKTGTLIAAAPIPVGPGQISLAFVLSDDAGKIYVIPAEAVKPA